MRITVSIPMTLQLAGGSEQYLDLSVTGDYEPAQRAFTPAGEGLALEPPETAVFEIDRITFRADSGRLVELPIDVLNADMLDEIERECIADCEARQPRARRA